MNLTELGRLTAVSYRDAVTGRRRAMRWGPTVAPILAYSDRASANLVIVYPVRPKGRATTSEIREYAKTHWGKTGLGERVEGLQALQPLAALGPALAVTYTTEKGFDRELTDYVHDFGEGAKGEWTPPKVRIHACKSRRCPFESMIAFEGGSYRVGARGIVG